MSFGIHLAAVAKNASGESLAQRAITSRPCSAQTALKGLQKNAWEKAVFEPSARPFGLPDWPGFQRLGFVVNYVIPANFLFGPKRAVAARW